MKSLAYWTALAAGLGAVSVGGYKTVEILHEQNSQLHADITALRQDMLRQQEGLAEGIATIAKATSLTADALQEQAMERQQAKLASQARVNRMQGDLQALVRSVPR